MYQQLFLKEVLEILQTCLTVLLHPSCRAWSSL